MSVVYSQNSDPIVTNESDSIIVPLKPVKNAVKTDVFGWFVGTGVLKYERVFSENISAQLGFFYAWDFPAYDEGYFATGFAITPEFRYYLSNKNPAPRGIYLAPNYRYQKLETEKWRMKQYQEQKQVIMMRMNLGSVVEYQSGWCFKGLILIISTETLISGFRLI